MKYLFLILFTAGAVFADEVPPTTNVDPVPPPEKQLIEATSPKSLFVNHEARIAKPVYVTEVPSLTQVHTKPMPVPDGFKMVEVQHPPLYSCTQYPQPSTWEMVAIKQPVQAPVIVGEDNVEAITIITDGE